MNELLRADAADLAARIAAGELSSVELTGACLDQIAATDGDYGHFCTSRPTRRWPPPPRSTRRSRPASSRPPAGRGAAGPQDVFTTSDMPTTCGSKILEGWRPPYDATVTMLLRAAGIPILGKTNMDEFAMGSSTENSAYHPPATPGTPSGYRAGPAAVAQRRWPRSRRRWRSAPTPAVRSASRPR